MACSMGTPRKGVFPAVGDSELTRAGWHRSAPDFTTIGELPPNLMNEPWSWVSPSSWPGSVLAEPGSLGTGYTCLTQAPAADPAHRQALTGLAIHLHNLPDFRQFPLHVPSSLSLPATRVWVGVWGSGPQTVPRISGELVVTLEEIQVNVRVPTNNPNEKKL